ncbi:amino acid adenylation domain-containing protein [Paenibacillus sp. N10]|uniref:Amino acid adenylation domain-containing protein n=2 Tax=Paenibacillus lutrae TaxID=2078573 RepID=A0A7X3FFL5_9BACL|nr:amino acid adenylation domain-containing protein [Paenibacillus lutrae]
MEWRGQLMRETLEVQKIYRLTPMQEGILYHSLVAPQSDAYFELTTLKIEGPLDVGLFQESFNQLIQRHDVLRTNFVYSKLKKPHQVICKKRRTTVSYEDLSSLPEEERLERLDAFKAQDKAKGFDLLKDILMRICIFKLGPAQYTLIRSHHHIILDGWSLAQLTREHFEIYNSLCTSTESDYPAPRPFQEYVDRLQKQSPEDYRSYWSDVLQDYETSASVPKYKSSKSGTDDPYARAELTFTFDAESTQQLNRLSQRFKCTVSNVFYTIWGILLQKYNRSDDVVFGSVVSGRPADMQGIDRMVGLFVNTIPVRIRCESRMAFAELLHKVQEESIASQKYDYGSLAEIYNLSVMKQNLFNHLIVFENFPVGKDLVVSGDADFRVTEYHIEEQTNYEMNIMVCPSPDFTWTFVYDERQYERSQLEETVGHFQKILEQVSLHPDTPVAEIELLRPEEKLRLTEWPQTASDGQDEALTLCRLIEEQSEQNPSQPAVVFDNRTITYGEFMKEAGRLASVLRSRGIGPGDVVGLLAARSPDLLISFMAIWMTGAAFLPLDAELPPDRIGYMLTDGGAKLLVTDLDRIGERCSWKGATLYLKDADPGAEEQTRASITAHPEQLAYILYTSGSTGEPKGVQIRHHSLVHMLNGLSEAVPFRQGKTILSVSSICFDVFLVETLLALANGLRIVMSSERQQKDPKQLSKLIQEHSVEIVQATPSRLKLLLNEASFASSCGHLEYILVAGEQFPPSLLRRATEIIPRTAVYNVYGPTEATIYTTIKRLTADKPITIGQPLVNYGVYIVDRADKLLPAGAIGELCIAGNGLAQGYVNKETLTNEKFGLLRIDSGSGLLKEERIYRTGDLARRLPDGDIDFLGRLDHQEKIRGFRIELDEVSSRLQSYPGVRDCLVTVNNDDTGDKFLTAYYLAEREMTVDDLTSHLSKFLPYYMIPSHFIWLEQFPMTASGKISLRDLPQPGGHRPHLGVAYMKPSTEIETTIAGCWSAVLKIDNIGAGDNFFDLGGNSIKLIELLSQMDLHFPGAVQITDFFVHPTIAKLAKHIEAGRREITTIEPMQLPGEYLKQADRERGQENVVLRYKLGPALSGILNEQADKDGVGTDDVLIGLFAFLLAEITGSKAFHITVYLKERLGSLPVDLADLTDFTSLYKKINNQLLEAEALNDPVSRQNNSGRDQVYIGFSSSTRMPESLRALFDLVLVVSGQNGDLSLLLEYNSRMMQEDKMNEILAGIGQLIEVVHSPLANRP